ncbi:MAG: hypothetical protein EOP04_09325 [Proteobacteria bacterium]|nr:MAG: hypothetical protein EOP04_09325 [Pseudomonadota bacterium]
MRSKALIISTILFLALSIAFAFQYDKVYVSGPDEQKGQYIGFCLEIGLALTIFYMIAAKACLRRSLPLVVVFVGPFFVLLLSLTLSLLACAFLSDTRDQKVLELFLIIQSISGVLLVLPFGAGWRKTVS